MPREMALLDALIPTLLIAFLVTSALHLVLNAILIRCDLYRYVWHPALVRAALFFCIFSLLGLLLLR